MNRQNHTWIYFRVAFCIFCACLTLYYYIDGQNALTELRLMLPLLSKEVKTIQEDNMRLRYEIDRFESPIHLMELLRKPEFSHLHYPVSDEIIILPMPEVVSSGRNEGSFE